MTPEPDFNTLLQQVKDGSEDLSLPHATSQLAYDAGSTIKLLDAALDGTTAQLIFLDGVITEGLELQNDCKASLTLAGTLKGSLQVSSTIGSLHLWGSVEGNVIVSGKIEGNLTIHGKVSHQVYVGQGAQICGDLSINGTDLNDLKIDGEVLGNLQIQETVAGRLDVEGTIHGNVIGPTQPQEPATSHPLDLVLVQTQKPTLPKLRPTAKAIAITGDIHGDATVTGTTQGGLAISGTIGRTLSILGPISGYLRIEKPAIIEQSVSIQGSAKSGIIIGGCIGGDLQVGPLESETSLELSGQIGGKTRIYPDNRLNVDSLSGAEFAEVVLFGENAYLQECDFRQFSDFQQLRFVGSDLFGTGRKSIANSQPDGPIPDSHLANLNRELRQTYERQSNRAEAGDFYFAEMAARNRALRPDWTKLKWLSLQTVFGWLYRKKSTTGTWLLIALYGLVSGYGQKPGRAFSCFTLLSVAGAALYLKAGLEITNPSQTNYHNPSCGEMLLFSTKSMVSFFNPPDAKHPLLWSQWVQLAQRFLGPVLLTQAGLALREKIAR